MAVVPDFVEQLADRIGDFADTPWLLGPLLLHHEIGDKRRFHAPQCFGQVDVVTGFDLGKKLGDIRSIFLDDGADPSGRSAQVLEFETTDQYTVQGDVFSESIREGTPQPVPLEGSIKNMAIIEAVFRSAKSGKWEEPIVPESAISQSH